MIANLTNPPSPLEPLPRLGAAFGLDLWVKRDDRLDDVAGGNKLRKARHVLALMPDTTSGLISVGGSGSNHLRTLALLARRHGLGIHCVIHGSHADDHGNLLLLRLAGAEITFCAPSEISGIVAHLCHERGPSWHFVPGGGHDQHGFQALVEAVDELALQLGHAAPVFDDIVLASGTGTTQAGLMHGVRAQGWSTRVLGISVARDVARGTAAVREALSWGGADSEEVHFDERFRFGGYGRVDPSLLELIRECMTLEGLPLDPTYTAKAMFGLRVMAEEGRIRRGARVLFWHTGGLINLLSEYRPIEEQP